MKKLFLTITFIFCMFSSSKIEAQLSGMYSETIISYGTCYENMLPNGWSYTSREVVVEYTWMGLHGPLSMRRTEVRRMQCLPEIYQ